MKITLDRARVAADYLALYAEHEQRQQDERHFWRCIRLGGCERHQGWLNRAPFAGWDALARQNGKTSGAVRVMTTGTRMVQMPPGWREVGSGVWTAPLDTPPPG